MKNNVLQAYKQAGVATDDPLRIVEVLYEAAIQNLEAAGRAIRNGEISERSSRIGKVLDIVSELRCCLDFERGGEIATSLDRLYGFVALQMTTANTKNDERPINDSIQVLSELLEAWREVTATESQAVR